jgi:hypothetical protein
MQPQERHLYLQYGTLGGGGAEKEAPIKTSK